VTTTLSTAIVVTLLQLSLASGDATAREQLPDQDDRTPVAGVLETMRCETWFAAVPKRSPLRGSWTVVSTVHDGEGWLIRLTGERWTHIVRRHPEMRAERARVLETVRQPHYILDGDRGTLMAVRLYDQTPLTRKHLVVVYRRVGFADGFIVTAYFTSSPAHWRRVVWPA
jgi:hypothetical protein